ncbi:OpgC domain-containing protein [Hoeflea sp. WL0058]|uniref:OpgC domain-containing protein n=1 Tax=Flavimaribacter sediminis TaxID=2865987 RepID=A0AAE3D2J5_9HYPH|nr:OpgC domain-containing protein [Flavimaribacter sediminis]MBW8638663.1 OpgC domain-containing protein [Flavimaribacter sediminis]
MTDAAHGPHAGRNVVSLSRDAANRNTSIDVIRALCLIMIFVNHVPGNPLERLTTKNFGFSDAAEIFVLLSGVSAAYAYGAKYGQGARLVTTLKIWRRSGVLYVAHLATTLATLGIFCFLATVYARPELLEAINIAPVIAEPATALVGVVTLGHQLGYNNILPVYAVMLLLLPIFLAIGKRSLTMMVALSGSIWIFSGWYRIGFPNYPNDGVWFLNPLSWQFLFVIGIAAALYLRRGGELPARLDLIIGCIAYLVLSFAWVRIPLWGVDASFDLPAVLTGFDKTFLSLPRLLHVLAAGYLIAMIPQLNQVFRLSARNPLAVLGRHALPVFLLGTLLAMAAQAWRIAHGSTALSDIAIVCGGTMLLFALAWFLEWHRELSGNRSAARSGQIRDLGLSTLVARGD